MCFLQGEGICSLCPSNSSSFTAIHGSPWGDARPHYFCNSNEGLLSATEPEPLKCFLFLLSLWNRFQVREDDDLQLGWIFPCVVPWL